MIQACDTYSVVFDEHNQTIVFSGSMRPSDNEGLPEVKKIFAEVIDKVSGTLYIDFKKLSKINNTAFKVIFDCISWMTKNKPDLRIQVLTTSVVAWGLRKFSMLKEISPAISVEEYDREFYPGQGVIENESFIPVLRTQTKIIWGQEKAILARHGLKEGMRIADVCCGIGDFAVEVLKTFKPVEIVAVDHSKPSLKYAREVARQFGLSDIEYVYGDAAALLLEDNSFDFVTCRLSLQIFDMPELILKELYRICKPGGRVYLTNETYSKCFGDPHAESIRWTYQEASRLFGNLGMNLEFGTKMLKYLKDCNFENIMIEPMIPTNINADPQAFADVIQSWEDYVVGKLAVGENRDEAYCNKLKAGFQDHIRSVTHPKGFGGWPIWVGSGRK